MKFISTRRTAFLAGLAFLALSGWACSSSTTTPANTSSVTMTAETEGIRASSAFTKIPSTASGTVADSIEITRVRFLLSAVKLHVEGNDTLHDGQIKAG